MNLAHSLEDGLDGAKIREGSAFTQVMGERAMSSATIKIYLPHGDPKRLRTGEISNWSGKAVAGPRTELGQILKRDEASCAGVYILSGVDPFTGDSAAYIGEAESIKDRIKQHLSKDFWSQLVFFTSKDENLTKAHVRFLEGRLITLANGAKRVNLTNSQASSSGNAVAQL